MGEYNYGIVNSKCYGHHCILYKWMYALAPVQENKQEQNTKNAASFLLFHIYVSSTLLKVYA